jgi:hypothetical protein
MKGVTHTAPQLSPAEEEKRMKEVESNLMRREKEKNLKLVVALQDFSAPMRFWIALNLWLWGTLARDRRTDRVTGERGKRARFLQ